MKRQQTWLMAMWAVALMLGTGSLAAAPAQAQEQDQDQDEEALPLNQPVAGATGGGDAKSYLLEVEEPGVVTVVVRAARDVRLKVVDEFYQPLLGGEVDMDLGGDFGAEQLVTAIPQPGEYHVIIETFNPNAPRVRFRMVSGFLPFPDLAAEVRPNDGDGTPANAEALTIGERTDGSLQPDQGNLRDWYSVEAPGDGQLIVTTRADDGDIVLDAFEEGNYRESIANSDQDLQGNRAHETLVVEVNEGETYLVRVSTFNQQPVPDYNIRATFAAY